MTKKQRLVVVISILASFVAFLDGSIVNVALPAIVDDLGGGLAVQQWIVDAYLLTLGSLILLAGSLSDLFGRKRVLTYGLIGFGLASILCAIAPTSLFLIIARALQGAAGALLVPSSLALIISTFSGKAQGKAIGTWTAWTGIAFVVGPLAGGLLVDSGAWRSIFAINIIPIAITLWLMTKLTADEKVDNKVPLDISGAILGVLGLAGPVYALIEQPKYGWGDPMVYVPLILGLLIFIWFILHEKRTKNPMLPLSLFTVRNFSVGNIATLAIYAGLSVATFMVAVFVQQAGGYSAIQAGLALMPVTIIMFVLSPRFGALAGRYGPRFFMAAGPFVIGIGFLLMLLVDEQADYITQLLPGVLALGLGLSMTVAPLTSAVLGSITAAQAGIGSAVNNAVARIAGLVAIAMIGLIVGELNVVGFHRGVVFMALLLFIGGIVSAIGITNSPKKV